MAFLLATVGGRGGEREWEKKNRMKKGEKQSQKLTLRVVALLAKLLGKELVGLLRQGVGLRVEVVLQQPNCHLEALPAVLVILVEGGH